MQGAMSSEGRDCVARFVEVAATLCSSINLRDRSIILNRNSIGGSNGNAIGNRRRDSLVHIWRERVGLWRLKQIEPASAPKDVVHPQAMALSSPNWLP